MTEPLITATDVTLGFGEENLLEGQSFEIARGEIFAILGRSGCGKSALLRVLIGLDEPKAGSVMIAGVGPPRLEVGRPPYGVMFQSGALFGSMTLAQNVALPLRTWAGLDDAAIDTVVRSKLDLVGLGGFENHLPSEISGGMKKRAAIARALALDAPLIFLDEPSAARRARGRRRHRDAANRRGHDRPVGADAL